jgi:hypothetical protein
LSPKSKKFVLEFCGLDPTGRRVPVDTATLSCFNQDFVRFFCTSSLLFSYNDVITKDFSAVYAKIKICRQPLTHSLSRNHHADFFDGNPFVDGILGHSLLLFQAFLVGIPSWVGFEATTCCCLRPNSGYHKAFHELFSFFHDGILAITKPFSRTFFFHDGIMAIMEPFS